MSMGSPHYPALKRATFRHPIIDNHAHNLLKAENSTAFPLEGVATEANGAALEDSKTSLALYRAVIQLSKLYRCEPSLEAVKEARNSMPYEDLCRICFELTGITCLFLDDLLNNVKDLCNDYQWHDQFMQQRTKRIIRVEVLAEELIRSLYDAETLTMHTFKTEFKRLIGKYCCDKEVVGFKSIICYRTGLDIATGAGSINELEKDLQSVVDKLRETGTIRLAYKGLNDFIVLSTLNSAGMYNKPVQFHTGLGDNDITLATANPSVMQPLIKAYPNTNIVLLHSSYPFCREAGYLASVYKNVYLDFGEVFPMVSHEGQLAIVRQVLEITPTNKLLWSTDGHWWPESYYLAVLQAREALYKVLSHSVAQGHLTESQAVEIVKNVFYRNSNKLYDLNLPPSPSLLAEELCPIFDGPAKDTNHALIPHTTLDTLADGGAKFIRVHWVDYNNLLHYRILSLKHVKSMLSRHPNSPLCRAGIGLGKSGLALINNVPAEGFSPIGEYFLAIDMDSIWPPSYASKHAFAMGTFQTKDFVDGEKGKVIGQVNTCPRTILKRIVENAKTQQGLEFLVGFEVEFVLLDANTYQAVNNYGWSRSSGIPGGSSIGKCLDEIAEHIEDCGVVLEQFHSEGADGQYEVVTGPLPPLQAVDALILTREIISNVAEKYGFRATATPKAISDQGGTAIHAHISLTSSKPNVPSLKAPINNVEASFLQSVLDHLPAICAFSLASPASYWRVSDNTWSGGTWVCWGRDNRETPVRLCGTADQGWNFEIKPLDGTSNPYLAISAILFCGALGVQKNLKLSMNDVQSVPGDMDPEDRRRLGIVERIPKHYEEAIFKLVQDKELIAGLGKKFVDIYISATKMRRNYVDSLAESEHKLWMIRNY